MPSTMRARDVMVSRIERRDRRWPRAERPGGPGMRLALLRLALSLVILAAGVTPALAQSGTTRTALSGTVLDSGGGALPGVSVEVKHNRTGVVTTTVTNDTGV